MITKFWQWLFGKGCEHQWVIIKQGDIKETKEILGGYFYHLRCDKCGWVIKRNFWNC